MTDKQINIAIAEACGWSKDDIERGYTLCQFSENIPDYCNDLNAMHEAEATLNYEQAEQHEDELYDICYKENFHKEYPLPFRFAVAHATAQQRAEAFLKTIGKWKEARSE
jgi:hypothetical protein